MADRNETLTTATMLVRAPDCVNADLDEELILMSIETGEFYSLNETGRRVWHLLAEPASVATIATILAAEFDVDVGSCESDVLALVRDLQAEALIVAADAHA